MGTIENTDEPAIEVPGVDGRFMNLHRVKTEGKRKNARPINIHTGRVDGGAIYGSNKKYEQEVLRETGTCRLRESMAGFLPITSEAEDGIFKFVAGDSRVDEHAILTAMHTVHLFAFVFTVRSLPFVSNPCCLRLPVLSQLHN